MAKDDSKGGGFAELFDKLEAALGEATAKKAKVAKLATDLDTAQHEYQGAVEAVKALQLDYADRLGGVHPDLATGVTSSL